MRKIGNIPWFVLGSMFMQLAWFFFGLLAFITIIGIPLGIQHLKLAGISVFPIGKTIVSKEVVRMVRHENV